MAQQIASETKIILKRILRFKNIVLGMGLIAVTSLNVIIGKYLIPVLTPVRVAPTDLVFHYVSYQDFASGWSNWAVFAISILLFYSIIKNRLKNVRLALMAFVLFFLLRGFVIILTPFAEPLGIVSSTLNRSSIFWDNGYFFSGHSGHLLLSYLFINHKFKWAKRLAFFMIVFGIVGMLLSRAHYSIDIYGGLITALAIYFYLKDRFKVNQ